jgi:hypothetical protein
MNSAAYGIKARQCPFPRCLTSVHSPRPLTTPPPFRPAHSARPQLQALIFARTASSLASRNHLTQDEAV